jgi:hypothetical protein
LHFHQFFRCLEEKQPSPHVDVEYLRDIVNLNHVGVGKVTFKYFKDFEGASLGTFIWLEEDRTSAHEEPFSDAVVFVNDKFANDERGRRIVSAKELMHVFDTPAQRSNTPQRVESLMREIESNPVTEDASEQYNADRYALWKAILCLVPPWLRDEYKEA